MFQSREIKLLSVRCVCVVDDDSSFRQSLGNLLKAVGYRAVVFSSGEKFLQSSVVNDALCVLLDLKMQGLQGLDVQQHLKNKGCQVPVVLMSSCVDDSAVRRAMLNGAMGFLKKPFSDEQLLDFIELATARRLDTK